MKKISIILSIVLICLLAISFVACGTSGDKVIVTVLNGEGGGEYATGSQVTITANIPEGKVFVGWKVMGEVISTENPYTFTVQKDIALVPLFENPVISYEITVQGGRGGGTYVEGEEVSVSATLATEYKFVGWTENGETVSTENPYIFTAEKDRNLVAVTKAIGYEEYTSTLYKKADEDFVILNLTDIQLHNGNTTDVLFTILDELVERTQPDLIIHLGDLQNDNKTYGTKTMVKTVLDKIDSYNIPWAFIFGNHDKEDYTPTFISRKDMRASEIASYALSLNNCVYKNGPKNVSGLSNYIINIVEEGSNKLVESLYMLDSCLSGLDNTHTDFYNKAVQYTTSLNNGEKVDSIVYTHIALPAYGDVYESEKLNQYTNIYGSVNRDPCDLASGSKTLFSAIQQADCTKNVICGHDHDNAYYAYYQGVRLIYTMKTGEGDEFPHVTQMGGSTFTLDGENVEFEFQKSRNAYYLLKKDTTFYLDTLPLWQYSGATFSFDFSVTGDLEGNRLRFALFGSNIKRLQASEKERYGAWNRLVNYINIYTDTMTASAGTITSLGNGNYRYSVDLLDLSLNLGSGEEADGTETLRLAYFDIVEKSLKVWNMDLHYPEIDDTEKTDLSGAVVTIGDTMYYDGNPKTPALTVKVGATTLQPKVDYKVIFSNNIEKGTATATILPSGKGASLWKGEKVVTFEIVPNPDEDTNNDHINAITITGSYDNKGKIEKIDNWRNSNKILSFEYKKLSYTNPQNGDTIRISLMDNSWKRLSAYLTFNLSNNTLKSGDTVLATGEDIGDGWYRIDIDLSNIPLNTNAGEVATGTETFSFFYIDNVTRAFKIDNVSSSQKSK